jgi:hypothetical protein
MQSKTLGRALGIGLRKAGGKLLEPAPPEDPRVVAARQATRGAEVASAARATGERSRRVATGLGRGTRNFTRAVWNPFALATGVLWLEITGAFFALFALFFAQHLYELRGAWRAGPEHSRFLLYAALTLLFLYFCGSSFVRAGRKQRAAAAGNSQGSLD